MRILIADDDITNRRMLEAALKRRNYSDIVCAEDGNSAWDIINADPPPDIVLIDWMMPGMSGLEICKQLRAKQQSKYIYIILITAKSEYRDYMEGIGAGADEYLTKPLFNEELYVRVLSGVRVVNNYKELASLNQNLEQTRQQLELQIADQSKTIERTTILGHGSFQLKSDLLVNMIKEIGQPINKILAALNELLSTELTAQQLNELETIRKCISDMQAVTENSSGVSEAHRSVPSPN